MTGRLRLAAVVAVLAVAGIAAWYFIKHPSADPGLTLLVYTAAPDSPGTADALTLLAAWAATLDAEAATASSGTARSGTAPSPAAD